MNNYLEPLKKKLAGKLLGHPLYYFDEIGSTNDEAFRLGAKGAPEGTVVIADAQTAGKGRLQRVWHSPAGANIYTSVILRPAFEPARAPQVSIAAGLAVAETIHDYFQGGAQLKWPNDVLIGGKKVCGILAQMKMAGAGIDFVVVGIGMNVNGRREQFPKDIEGIATSLAIEAGNAFSRQDLIFRLYENLTKWYKSLLHRGFEPVREAWLALSPMIGRAVQVAYGEETIGGIAVGLAEDGSLMLRTNEQTTLRVTAGDATIIKR